MSAKLAQSTSSVRLHPVTSQLVAPLHLLGHDAEVVCLPVIGRRTSSCVQHTLRLCPTLSKRVCVSVLVVGMEYWDQHKKAPAAVWSRPASARGTFLRIISVNDVYKLGNYPRVATAVKAARAAAKDMDFVCISTLPGDFLSPCALTSLDGGRAMMKGKVAEVCHRLVVSEGFNISFLPNERFFVWV